MNDKDIVSADGADRIDRLVERNEQLKDELLTLLQADHQVSDATIKSGYQDLCNSIDFWLDNVIEDSKLRLAQRPGKKDQRRLSHQLRDFQIPESLSYDGRSFAYLILSAVIMCELQRQIFNRTLPLGTSREQERVVNHILVGMHKRESGRGQSP